MGRCCADDPAGNGDFWRFIQGGNRRSSPRIAGYLTCASSFDGFALRPTAASYPLPSGVAFVIPSDMSDDERALVAPMIPPPRRGGRPRDVNVREVLNAVFYVLATGCQALPRDLPPRSTAHHYFILWDRDGTLVRIHDALYVAVREAAGREASPSAAIIDSQSAKAAQKGGLRWTLTRKIRSEIADGERLANGGTLDNMVGRDWIINR